MSTRESEDPHAPAFAAFCEAGLWPGMTRALTAALPEAGIRARRDVSAGRLVALPRVAARRAQALSTAFTQAEPTLDVVELIEPAGLPPRVARRIVDALGAGAAAVLGEDPWRALQAPEVSPTQADRLARSVCPDATRADPRRGRALVSHLLNQSTRDGHTAMRADAVLGGLATFGVPDAAAALASAIGSGMAVECEDGLIALEQWASAEKTAATRIGALLADAEDFGHRPKKASGELDPAQRAAVDAVSRSGVSVLTGGPGTGKSRTVAAVVELAHRAGKRIALAAPTGRAAARLEELTGEPASTVHRLLGAQGYGGGFSRGADWPLDAELVVVDEASMLDAELTAALVSACATRTHLMLVGDPAQLPSIGAGRVLGDVLDAAAELGDRLPVTELTTMHRQAEGGAIARLATAIRGGVLPPVDDPDREVVVVPAAGGAQAAFRTVQLVTDSIPRALGIESGQIQVVTPVHAGDAGTKALNAELKARLNPGAGTVSGFDVGDRVVATANHPEAEPTGFANGEVGTVRDAGGGVVTVAFPGGDSRISGRALSDLLHGWAITVHRAQGSEWPAVVAVLPVEASRMLTRPLVYTALTRAQRHLSIVHAAGPALARAVHDVDARPRLTRLRDLLVDAVRS